jgi:hypothetical protein
MSGLVVTDAFVSVVLPVHEEVGWDADLLRALEAELAQCFPMHEIVVVVSRGPGHVAAKALALTHSVPNLQVLVIGRRPAREVMTTAGLDHAMGDVIVLLDSVADDPAAIGEAVRQVVEAPSMSVYGANESAHAARVGRPLGRWVASAFVALLDRTAGLRIPITEPGFRAVSRATLNHWADRDDRDRTLAVMPVLADPQTSVLPYAGDPKFASRPRLRRDVRVGLRTLMSVSPLLLRLGWVLAVLGSLLSLAYSVAVITIALVKGNVVEGWLSLSLLISGMFFLVSLVLALLCEYVLRLDRRSRGAHAYRIESEATSSSLCVVERSNVDDPLAAQTQHPFSSPRGSSTTS